MPHTIRMVDASIGLISFALFAEVLIIHMVIGVIMFDVFATFSVMDILPVISIADLIVNWVALIAIVSVICMAAFISSVDVKVIIFDTLATVAGFVGIFVLILAMFVLIAVPDIVIVVVVDVTGIVEVIVVRATVFIVSVLSFNARGWLTLLSLSHIDIDRYYSCCSSMNFFSCIFPNLRSRQYSLIVQALW